MFSPVSGRALRGDTAHSLAAGGERWPVVDGIAYLRTGREALIGDTLRLLDAGRIVEATALLLGDQDDWARTPPASFTERYRLVRDREKINFRAAMEGLAFGPVATYFAHRWSDPTFLSGLALAEAHWTGPGTVVELACGAGHYLREFTRVGAQAVGGDIVFAKLWLARHFIAPSATLVCFDAAAPWPLGDAAAELLFCHDAFYFLPGKPHVAAEMHRVSSGAILVGHAHNRLVDNFSAGEPLAPGEYAGLFDSPRLYDDAALTAALVAGTVPEPQPAGALEGAAAVSIAARAPAPRAVVAGLAMPAAGAALVRNPLYGGDGAIVWPSARYEQEYAGLATYPAVLPPPSERDVRTRVLLDLPARW